MISFSILATQRIFELLNLFAPTNKTTRVGYVKYLRWIFLVGPINESNGHFKRRQEMIFGTNRLMLRKKRVYIAFEAPCLK